MSRLPTPGVPNRLHADLEAPGAEPIPVTAREEAMIQVAMIRAHAVASNIPPEQAALSWVSSGLAALFRQHYRRIE